MAEGSLDQFESRNEEDALQEIRRRLKKFADDELASHPEDLERVATIEVAHGHPVVKILETADRLNVDVIVMGAHGKGLIEHAFLGSTTEKVLRKTSRPVFVIPIA
jgi:nucleotide-binding universal stress UspA family protein